MHQGYWLNEDEWRSEMEEKIIRAFAHQSQIAGALAAITK
jgi:hypothetical protein